MTWTTTRKFLDAGRKPELLTVRLQTSAADRLLQTVFAVAACGLTGVLWGFLWLCWKLMEAIGGT